MCTRVPANDQKQPLWQLYLRFVSRFTFTILFIYHNAIHNSFLCLICWCLQPAISMQHRDDGESHPVHPVNTIAYCSTEAHTGDLFDSGWSIFFAIMSWIIVYKLLLTLTNTFFCFFSFPLCSCVCVAPHSAISIAVGLVARFLPVSRRIFLVRLCQCDYVMSAYSILRWMCQANMWGLTLAGWVKRVYARVSVCYSISFERLLRQIRFQTVMEIGFY